MNETFQKVFATFSLILVAFVYSVERRDAAELKAIRLQLDELKKLVAGLPAPPAARVNATPSQPPPAPAALVSSDIAPTEPPVSAASPQNLKSRFGGMAGLIKNQMIEMEVQEIKEAISITPEQETQLRKVFTDHPLASFDGSETEDPNSIAERMREQDDAVIAVIGQENFDAAKEQKSSKYKKLMEEEKERRIAYWQKKLELDDQQRIQFSQLLEDAERADLGDSEFASIDPAQLAKDPAKALEYLKQRNQRKNAWLEEQAKAVLNAKQQARLKELSAQETSPFGSAGRFHSF